MAEWLKALDSKSSNGAICSWVRIPLSPQNNEPEANASGDYILREKVGFELSLIRSLNCNQFSEDEA